MKILLFGVTCAGKTTLGKMLAKQLGYTFFDVDDGVKSEYGTIAAFYKEINDPIKQSVAKQKMMLKAMAQEKDLVIAVSPLHSVSLLKQYIKKNIGEVLCVELYDSIYNISERFIMTENNKEEMTNKIRDEHGAIIYDLDVEYHYFFNIYYDLIDESLHVYGRSPEAAAEELRKTIMFTGKVGPIEE